MQKRTDELVPGDRILTEDNEQHLVKLTFDCEDHMRVVTDTDEIGICIHPNFLWEVM